MNSQYFLKNILLHNISDEWLLLIENVELMNCIDKLNEISTPNMVIPKQEDIFNFARIPLNINDIKIVIIGQDPYPNGLDACGFAFASPNRIPPSLKNIYKCLEKNQLINNKSEIKSADLLGWASQGVMLYNYTLTTMQGQSNSHTNIWKSFSQKFIQEFSRKYKKIVYILWGRFAQTLEKIIDKNDNEILTFIHPSPLAGTKFIDCDNFINANIKLENWNKTPIMWNIINMDDYVRINKLRSNVNEKKEQKIDYNNTESDMKNNTEIKSDSEIMVFTDGSCNPNNSSEKSVGTYACLFVNGVLDNTVIYGKLNNYLCYSSNNRAEGTAILRAIKFVNSKFNENKEKIKKLTIITDSQFWINMIIKFIPSWIKKQQPFENYKNPDIVKELWDEYQIAIINYQVTFTHMYSHNKNNWNSCPKDSYEYFCYCNNDYVDQMCIFARDKLDVGEEVIKYAMVD